MNKDRYGTTHLNDSYVKDVAISVPLSSAMGRMSPEVPPAEQPAEEEDVKGNKEMLVDGFIHLDELAEEDKFFLIQQIEDLNKNIRYTCK